MLQSLASTQGGHSLLSGYVHDGRPEPSPSVSVELSLELEVVPEDVAVLDPEVAEAVALAESAIGVQVAGTLPPLVPEPEPEPESELVLTKGLTFSLFLAVVRSKLNELAC